MARIFDLQQGSEDWHKLRAGGIGSSDAGILCGFTQWKSVEQLWLEKSGQIKTEFKTNPAMERGTRLEPGVRAEYELLTDMEWPSAVFVHDTHSFLIASLDGWNEETKAVLEIKAPNAKAHATARAGLVPDYYQPQCQHLLFVSGGEKLIYRSTDGRSAVSVEVLPDKRYHENLLEKCIKFWDCVKSLRSPVE